MKTLRIPTRQEWLTPFRPSPFRLALNALRRDMARGAKVSPSPSDGAKVER